MWDATKSKEWKKGYRDAQCFFGLGCSKIVVERIGNLIGVFNTPFPPRDVSVDYAYGFVDCINEHQE